MNLFELQQRLNSAALAGADLIGEDFRLKKAIEQFGEMSSANPVFKKIYQTIKPLCDDTGNKTESLLEAVTLVNAVCTAAAVTGKPEQTRKIGSSDTEPVQCRYSEVSALQYAIDEKGSGRYEIIKNAFDTDSKALLDYRIKPYLYKGLNDGYAEIGVLCGQILIKKYGKEAVDTLKNNFDRKGGTESVRKIRALEIMEAAENDFFLSLVNDKSASIAVREESVYALRFEKENTDLLIEILNNGDRVKLNEMAYRTLNVMDNHKAKKAIDKYRSEQQKKRGN